MHFKALSIAHSLLICIRHRFNTPEVQEMVSELDAAVELKEAASASILQVCGWGLVHDPG